MSVWCGFVTGSRSAEAPVQRRCLPLLPQTPHCLPLQIDGDSAYDARRGTLTWSIDLLDESNKTGSLEFRTAAQPDSAFFPIAVHFTAKTTLCKVCV